MAAVAGQSLLSAVSVDELDEWRLSLWARLMDRTGRTEDATQALRRLGVEATVEVQPERVTVEPRMIRRPKRVTRPRFKRLPGIRAKQGTVQQQPAATPSPFGSGGN